MIYVTYGNIEEAKKIVSCLLEKKLISCANLFPVQSAYWWKSRIENSDEVVSILKAKKENWERVKNEIEKLHSYKTSCIVKIDVEANKDFEEWINSAIS